MATPVGTGNNAKLTAVIAIAGTNEARSRGSLGDETLKAN
jgi:hypothetical protein